VVQSLHVVSRLGLLKKASSRFMPSHSTECLAAVAATSIVLVAVEDDEAEEEGAGWGGDNQGGMKSQDQ
jgi:hypothetical protein